MSGEHRNPPTDLTGFPHVTVPAGTLLYRTHLPGAPLLFSSTQHGRFNLRRGEGTVYIARDPGTTLAQYIAASAGRFRTVHAEHLAVLTMTVYELESDHVVADGGSPNITKFFVDDELFTTPESGWKWTRRWARALRAAGFDGISFNSRYQPTDKASYLSLFGPTGQHPPMREVGKIDHLREVAESIDYTVANTPTLRQLKLVDQ